MNTNPTGSDAVKYRMAITDQMAYNKVWVNGKIIPGCAVGNIVRAIRGAGLTVPADTAKRDAMLLSLGYKVVEGKTPRFSKNIGVQFVQPASVVISSGAD